MLAGNKILDDLAKVAGGTVSALSGLHGEIKTEIKARAEEIVHKLDLVPREDLEKLESMLIEAREEQERLSARLEALENKKTKKSKG